MRTQSLFALHLAFPDIDGLWSHRDLSETEADICSRLPADNEKWTAEQVKLSSQLSRVLCLQEKWSEARKTLEKTALHLQQLAPSEKSIPEIQFHLEQGRYFCLSHFPAKALDAFKAAWILADKEKLSIYLIDIAYMFSITLPAKSSREWMERALDLAKSSQDPRAAKWLPHLYMAEAWTHMDAQRFEKAQQIFGLAEKMLQTHPDPTLLKSLLWSQARTLRALGKYDDAFRLQEKALQTMGSRTDNNGFIYLEMAESLLALHKRSEAQSMFQSAFDHLQQNKWYADNYADELERMKALAKKIGS